MSNFFDKLTGKDKNKKNAPTPQLKNPFANLGKAGNRKFGGQGQSLGGSKPGKLIHVSIPDQGPIGIKVEKRPNSQETAIVAMVVPGGQGERAGLQRGDILCFPDSNGEEEIMYKQFLQMAASDMRPLNLDVRRISTNATDTIPKTASAEVYARKQAVIAAAEAREKSAKAKARPIGKGGTLLSKKETQPPVNNEFSETPMSLEAKKAVEAAKNSEEVLASQLGYNPYETNKVTAGQARNATVTVQHGAVGKSDGKKKKDTPDIPKVASPPGSPKAADAPVGEAFEEAYTAVVTTNEHDIVVSSFGIMRKLITNAITKGQQEDEEVAAKFRKVRLTNAKIQAAITHVHGALDLMMSVGFQLAEEDGESFLVYPPGDKGPGWLQTGLNRMQQYEESS